MTGLRRDCQMWPYRLLADLELAAKKAAEHLEIDADERLANIATALRVYGENYTTNKGRQERLQQIG